MATVDGLTLHASVLEMQDLLTGGKIDKINQPEHDEIHLQIRNNAVNYKLLICANPETCRIHITETKKQNPIDAPMFCMLLRKHLSGGRIIGIRQINTDRLVAIDIESTDELYNIGKYTLMCEIMGRQSNIILLDSKNNIIDACKRIGLPAQRLILPGLAYAPAPTAAKVDPLSVDVRDLANIFSANGKISKLLCTALYGLAPIVAENILYESGAGAEYAQDLAPSVRNELCESIYTILRDISQRKTKPCLAKLGDREFFLPFLPKKSEYTAYDTAGALFDAYFAERDKKESMRRKSYSLFHAVEAKLARAKRRLAMFDEAIAKENDYDKYRVYGELISANMYRIRSGQKSVTVQNYYDEKQSMIEIPLDESLSPVRNSQKYFKLYKKAKGARDTAIKMRSTVEAEAEYLTAVEDCIQRAQSADELDEIRAELEQGEFIRSQNVKKRKKVKKSAPYSYTSTDGYQILVGKNNVLNDEITFKTAAPNDIWLHVKDRPGSHTVILNPNKTTPPDSTLLEAATIAARHSSAANGATVDVDYTLCRYVKKPSGALPGKVIYTNQKSILVKT